MGTTSVLPSPRPPRLGVRDRLRASAEESPRGGEDGLRVSRHHSCSNGRGTSRTCGGPGCLAWAALRWGELGQGGLRTAGRPCGHCPICDVSSEGPVVNALPAALAPDPLAGRALDTFCFERKQTLLKLLLGARTASLAPSLGGWWTSEFQGDPAGEASQGVVAGAGRATTVRQPECPEGRREPPRD